MSSVSALDSLLSSASSSSSSSTLDLSSILEAAFGASSEGIDVTAAVNAGVTAAEAPEQTWETQESTLQSQTTALQQLQTDATSLDTDMQSLNNLTGPLSARTVNSSNSNIVTASASSGATVGNHVVVVNSLASTDTWTSGVFANANTALPAGSITLTTSTGTATVTTDGTTTLSDVANSINSDNLGVTASVVTDATGARLAIVANTSGTAANFSVTSPQLASYGFTETAGANASLTVDGIAIQSATNTVANAVPGLTLNLLSADPGTQVSLGVSPDTSQASTAINQFVTDYNALITAVNSQFEDTSGSGQGVLSTDPNMRNLQSELEGALSYTATDATGNISSLASFGISVNSDGTLSVDSSALSSSLQNNYNDVQNFFQGSALNGFANSLDQQLSNFTNPVNGAFTVDLQSISTETSTIETDITNFQSNVITPLKAQLQSEYSQAEIALQQLPTEMKQIQEELGDNSSSNG